MGNQNEPTEWERNLQEELEEINPIRARIDFITHQGPDPVEGIYNVLPHVAGLTRKMKWEIWKDFSSLWEQYGEYENQAKRGSRYARRPERIDEIEREIVRHMEAVPLLGELHDAYLQKGANKEAILWAALDVYTKGIRSSEMPAPYDSWSSAKRKKWKERLAEHRYFLPTAEGNAEREKYRVEKCDAIFYEMWPLVILSDRKERSTSKNS